MDGKGAAGETEAVDDVASPSPKQPFHTYDAKLNTKRGKLDSLVEKGAQLATALLQDTRLSLQRGLPGKIENLLIRQSTLEACKPIHERIRSYVRKRVPPSEVHIIELELTELMSRVAQSEKDRAEADIRLLQEQKRAVAEAERHALEVDRLEKRLQEAVDYERKKGESALYDLRQDMLRLELEKMRVTSEAARERSSWELAEETRRKKHREFLIAEADQKARARVAAIREESEASARFTEERFAERLAAECARMRIEITASLQAESESVILSCRVLFPAPPLPSLCLLLRAQLPTRLQFSRKSRELKLEQKQSWRGFRPPLQVYTTLAIHYKRKTPIFDRRAKTCSVCWGSEMHSCSKYKERLAREKKSHPRSRK